MTVDSYGDVTAEYQVVHRGTGVIDGEHQVVRVAGPDAESFLDSLLSQDLVGLDGGTVVRSLLLGPRGKLRALLWVARFGEEFLLVADSAAAANVVDDLTRFKLRVDVEIAPPEPVLDLIGPTSVDVGAGLGEPARALPAPLGGLSRFFVTGATRSHLVDAGARPVGRLAYTAARVEMGEPAMGADVDESTIPQEAGVVAESVSFTKGCYLGQELVARIDSRGHVNRHLRGVVLAENALPPERAEVVDGDAVVGSITSVSESLQVGAPIGLGLIRREVEPGSPVEIRWPGGSAAAEIRALPLI
ncbi:MAG: hypothetical protein HKN80_01595 [Acidimicrobiia bacterium]|nr:hypothetical protein [Acidimicrobiia bacterium]